MSPDTSPWTRILAELPAGEAPDTESRQALLEAVYPELRRLAGHLMKSERPNHTLQPTALVHEAYVKLVDDVRIPWENRAHFLAIAARAMRQILVDHARRVQAEKRGGDLQRVTLDDMFEDAKTPPVELLDLHHALEKFSSLDPRAAQVVELKIFGGMKMLEIASVLDVSERTAAGDWAMARMWLARALS